MNGNGQAAWSLADYALWYADRGWPVFPVHSALDGACTCRKGLRCSSKGKHPRTRNGLHAASTDAAWVRSWWQKWPRANIGVATGQVSGLVVLDVDKDRGGVDTMKRLQEEIGRLPDAPTAQTGGGGQHVLFRHPGRVVHNRVGLVPGLDVRGDGGYIVAPRSQHASGRVYEWLRPPDKLAPPELPESWVAFLLKPGSTERTDPGSTERPGKHKNAQNVQKAQECTCYSAKRHLAESEFCDAVSEAIGLTLPEGPGQRWRKQWELARRLRAMAGIGGPDLANIFVAWWTLASPKTSGTHSYEEAFLEFANAFQSVRFPWGVSTVTALLDKAKVARPPQAVAGFPTAEFRTLAALCRELQHEAGPAGVFFLSSHQAAELLGKHPKVVWQWLRLLVRVGVLELVKVGNRRQASEYRYLGGD